MVASRSADDEAPTSRPRGIPGPLSGQEATAGQGSSVSDLDQVSITLGNVNTKAFH